MNFSKIFQFTGIYVGVTKNDLNWKRCERIESNQIESLNFKLDQDTYRIILAISFKEMPHVQ